MEDEEEKVQVGDCQMWRCLFSLSNRGELRNCCGECGVNKGNAIAGR